MRNVIAGVACKGYSITQDGQLFTKLSVLYCAYAEVVAGEVKGHCASNAHGQRSLQVSTHASCHL